MEKTQSTGSVPDAVRSLMKQKKTKWLILLSVVILAAIATIYSWDELGIQEIPLQILQQKYETPESRYVSINGTPVHYLDQGKGTVIVALHGIVDSLHTWDEWARKMTPHYRVVRMDIPGFGLTGPVREGEYSKEMFTGFLHAFLNELKIENCILTGNSLGGAIAWNFALHYPEKVSQLILIDPAGYPMEIPWPLSLTETPGIRHVARFITPRWIYQLSLRQVLGDPSRVTDTLVDRFYELNLRPGNRDALIEIMDSLKKLNQDPAFSKSITNIHTPTLLLWGKKDAWIPVSHVSKWKKDVPGIHTILYEKIGHVPQLEIPDQVAQDMHQWISGNQEKIRDPGKGIWFAIAAGTLIILSLLLWMIRKKGFMISKDSA
jgi:pimeloyl-ACP methyl ester carboxylesterase